jgi:hypothetical protein
MSGTEQQRPWYRQFWPWFIAFPPAATVVGGAVTAWLAGAGPALVVDDYGQIGKLTAQHAARDEHAQRIGVTARLSLEASVGSSGVVSVTIAQADARAEFPMAIRLRFVHPTRAELDAEAVLAGARGRYAGRIARPPGRLYVHVADVERSWRLVGELAQDAAALELRPQETAP